jgi:hypothetical protein
MPKNSAAFSLKIDNGEGGNMLLRVCLMSLVGLELCFKELKG